MTEDNKKKENNELTGILKQMEKESKSLNLDLRYQLFLEEIANREVAAEYLVFPDKNGYLNAAADAEAGEKEVFLRSFKRKVLFETGKRYYHDYKEEPGKQGIGNLKMASECWSRLVKDGHKGAEKLMEKIDQEYLLLPYIKPVIKKESTSQPLRSVEDSFKDFQETLSQLLGVQSLKDQKNEKTSGETVVSSKKSKSSSNSTYSTGGPSMFAKYALKPVTVTPLMPAGLPYRSQVRAGQPSSIIK